MKPKQIWANYGVKDVAKTRKFYTDLGFKGNEGSNETDSLTSFFIGDDRFSVHFFAHDALHPEYRDKVDGLRGTNEVMFTLSADSVEEVDKWAEEVRKVGGEIISEPIGLGGHYYGFAFADPDGHKWNVFYM